MKKVLLIISVLLSLSIIFISTNRNQIVNADDDIISDSLKNNTLLQANIYNESFTANNYYEIQQAWKEGQVDDGRDQIVIEPKDVLGGTLVDSSESFGYGKKTVSLNPGEDLMFEVNVKDPGLYQFYLDYYILSNTRLVPNITIDINGEKQYTEMNNLELAVDWKFEGKVLYDRYGDELTPKSVIDYNWKYEESLYDPNYFFSEPLKFNLKRGINNVKITLNEGYVLLGDIFIDNRFISTPTYEEYKNKINQESKNIGKLITIEAEDIEIKSRQSIRAKYMRDPQVTPYEYKNRVLNVLDGFSFGDAGDKVTYTFDVEESGYYNLALKYYLDTNNGLPSHRKIQIDDEVPFKEFENYDFSYQSKWKNELLKDNEGIAYEVYLEKGQHTLSFSIDNVGIRDIYHELLNLLEEISNISKEVKKITGGLDDKDRNWKIIEYIPNLESRLLDINTKLTETITQLSNYTQNEDLPVIKELEIANNLILEFIEEPEELPNYLTKFSEGEKSAYGRINTILPSLIYNPLHMDKIYLFNDAKLPRANANLIVGIFEGVKTFLYSFFDPKYNEVTDVDDNTIEIWVNKSRLDAEILQRMIDESFTVDTGIKVQISIMPDENKIILSNAAGTTPDGVIGISTARPFELAIRGVTEDLSKYEGFYDLAEEYNPSTFIPYIYGDGVYAIPETQGVKLMFYRKDILSQLNVNPPETWDEVISLVPVLQKYDMNFYAPIGSENSYKGFDVTTPFIYQFGGQLYDESTMTTVINKDGAYDAFELMTDLYTVYNLPVTTSNFYQHFRNGTIPVGIGDANMYIQLKYAAPEIAGQWGVAPIPGIKNSEGVVERWDPTYSSSSLIFKDSEKKDKTWELIKWWSSAETQANFSYNLQATLGEKFLYMTANIEGFKQSAWPSDSKNQVLEQWNWIQATGKVPGDYILERELSNAWNKVIFDGVNSRVAVDESISTINLELERKLNEFGYMDENGNLIKPYTIPTIHNVERWVRRNEKQN